MGSFCQNAMERGAPAPREGGRNETLGAPRSHSPSALRPWPRLPRPYLTQKSPPSSKFYPRFLTTDPPSHTKRLSDPITLRPIQNGLAVGVLERWADAVHQERLNNFTLRRLCFLCPAAAPPGILHGQMKRGR